MINSTKEVVASDPAPPISSMGKTKHKEQACHVNMQNSALQRRSAADRSSQTVELYYAAYLSRTPPWSQYRVGQRKNTWISVSKFIVLGSANDKNSRPIHIKIKISNI